MAKIRGSVSINSRHCKGCELCIYECPQKSLLMSKKLNPKGYHYAFLAKDTCTGCVNCALVCPEACITVYRETKKMAAPVERVRSNGLSELIIGII
jgi:2-oxoglutarate ferredoxin oxidoreductase subunit delta